MDPNATLANLIDAAVNGDHRAMMTAAEALREWQFRGGFAPDDPRCSQTGCPDYAGPEILP